MAGKILIADETDAVRSIAVNLFRQRGYEVLTASAGAEAWEILKSGKIDLAVVNSALVGMDGYTISKLIKGNSSLAETKIILMLSQSEIVNQHKLIIARPDGTLTKPFAPADLLTKAGQILGEEFEPVKTDNIANLSNSVSEMAMDEDKNAREIDFESIFSDSEKNTDVEDIHMMDILSDEKESIVKKDDQLSKAGPDRGRDVEENSQPESPEPAQDDTIRLADDQYGLEEPFEPPEVEVPHDYSWFIREMKNEINAKPQESLQVRQKPSKPAPFRKKDEKSVGNFTVEEIGTSEIETSKLKGDTKVKDFSDAISIAEPDFTDNKDEFQGGKLALAEKLLIKELASKMAEKLVQQISRQDLRNLLEEVLFELKKY